jgi:3-oxoacyl-[acyl-carrier-protein] synthase II
MYKLQPLWLLKYLPNMLACHVTILHGAEGPSNTITCAEASGLLSIGESTRVIERGDVEMCFSGGAESRVSYVGLARMRLTGWLAPTGDETRGDRIIKPYDPQSPGGLLGEGGGILILEERESARERGATIYATIEGFGAGQSPPPVMPTMPDSDDVFEGAEEGLIYAIENAFEDAGVAPEEIDAIVPRGMGMPSADLREANTFRAIFGDRLAKIPIIATSPAIGNCMAASGPINVAVAARCLQSQSLPARLNAGKPAADLDVGPDAARPMALRRVLVCSGSIGGQNAAVVVGRHEE